MSWSHLTAALAPTVAILLAAVAAMATYNHAVTGDFRRMPYQEHLSQYVSTPLLVWQAEAPPKTYRHPRLERIHRGWERDQWLQQQTLAGWSAMSWRRLQSNGFFYTGWLLAWPLVLGLVCRVGAESWTARAAAASGVVLMVVVSWNFPHYLAPMLGAYAYLLGQGLRILQVRPLLGWERRVGLGQRLGRRIATGLVLATLVQLCLYLYPVPATVLARRPAYQRQALIGELAATGEQHLIVVRCDPVRHEFEEDWVFNGADFTSAPVLWAREMNPEADRRLLAHYRNRKAWLLDFDAPGRKLQPHPLAMGAEKTPAAAE